MIKKALTMLAFLVASTAAAIGIACIPNLNEPPAKYQVVTDDGVIFKTLHCGDAEEERVNPDYQHICQGVSEWKLVSEQ